MLGQLTAALGLQDRPVRRLVCDAALWPSELCNSASGCFWHCLWRYIGRITQAWLLLSKVRASSVHVVACACGLCLLAGAQAASAKPAAIARAIVLCLKLQHVGRLKI